MMVVHSETSTGVCSRLPDVREAIDAPATRRYFWPTPCRRWRRWITGKTTGAST